MKGMPWPGRKLRVFIKLCLYACFLLFLLHQLNSLLHSNGNMHQLKTIQNLLLKDKQQHDILMNFVTVKHGSGAAGQLEDIDIKKMNEKIKLSKSLDTDIMNLLKDDNLNKKVPVDILKPLEASTNKPPSVTKTKSPTEKLLHEYSKTTLKQKNGNGNSREIRSKTLQLKVTSPLLHHNTTIKQEPSDVAKRDKIMRGPEIQSTKFQSKIASKPLHQNTVKYEKPSYVVKDEKFMRGLIVDWWTDTCMNKTTWNNKWYPLIPLHPQDTTVVLTSADDFVVQGRLMRRIYGYIIVDDTAMYELHLESRDGAEMLLYDTEMNVGNFTDTHDVDTKSWSRLFYFNLTLQEMQKQGKKMADGDSFELYSAGRKNIMLKRQQVYYVEIFQGGRFYGQYKLTWKRENTTEFVVIGEKNLFHTKRTTSKWVPSKLYEMNRRVPLKHPPSKAEQSRLNYHNIPVLDASDRIFSSEYKCSETNWYKRDITHLYWGKIFVDYVLVYPRNYLGFTGGWPQNHLLMNETEALDVTRKTFERLDVLYNGSLELKEIVHVQHNVDSNFGRYHEWFQTHYFVEFDVRMKQQTYRFSQFVHMSPSGICFMADWTGKRNVMINILTPIRNQFYWLEYLLEMLQNVLDKSKENRNNINLVIVDYNSTDGNIESLLKSFDIKYQYIQENDVSFNKVRALNIGLNHVKDENSIVFIMDLHLQLPLNIFDRVRKFTVQRKTTFCPTLLKLQCGEHELFTDMPSGIWIDDGFGMMAMYKSDWTKIGGFNEKLFGHQWGGEDWELVDRIVGNGLYLVHDRMPRFYHVFHNNKKTWDGNHV